MAPAGLPAELVDDLFRHRYARMVSGLCRVLGPSRLDLAEDVVQEAILRALRKWPIDGVPDDPAAWLFRVARNLALDSLRRQRISDRVGEQLQRWAEAGAAEHAPSPREPGEIEDDTLRMLMLCSHPAVPRTARVPLILKTVCGFGVPAIARALLEKEATIAQRLVRAKARLQADDVPLEMPPAAERPARVQTVLQVLYLMFNEGYRAHAGERLVRSDVVDEAVRLCGLLVDLHPAGGSREAHALLSLMLLLGARLPARTDGHGELVPLARQRRGDWLLPWMQCGFHHLRLSIGGDRITPWHCEARIASLHAVARTYDDTDWGAILVEYDRLHALQPSPVVRLNRAVAVGKVHGASRGLEALAGLDQDKALDDYFLLGAVTAQLHWELRRFEDAARCLERALAQPCTDPERRLLEHRLQAVRAGREPEPW